MSPPGTGIGSTGIGGTALLLLSPPARAERVGEYLRLAGVRVRQAESGLHALTQLERELPGAVVCDERLEDMTGPDLLEIVRSDAQLAGVMFLLLGAETVVPSGPLDAALGPEATPAEVLEALRPVLDGRGERAAPPVGGSLDGLDLGDVLLALAQGGRTGRLRVSVLSSAAEVWVLGGQVVNARYGFAHGEDALLALLAGTRVLLNADYHFEAGDLAGVEYLINAPTQALLERAAGPSSSPST